MSSDVISWRGWVRRPGGWRLAIQVRGRRTAPALLMLQGQANSHRWWDTLRAEFAQDWLTITFDYRGTGDSQRLSTSSEAPWTTALFAQDALAVLRAIAQDSAAVYATSMGGRVAQELALARPDIVRRLALACTSPGGGLATERSAAVRTALGAPDPGERRRTMFDLFYTPAWVEAHGGYDRCPSHLLGDPSMSPSLRRRHLAVSDGHDAGGRLGEIRTPSLVIHGSDDAMVPAVNARALAAQLPYAELRMFPGRHGFFDEHRTVVSPLVSSFLLA